MAEKFIRQEARVTEQEAKVVGILAEAWNEYMKLPIEHPMAQQEFCTAIHECQDKVLARGGRRSLNSKVG